MEIFISWSGDRSKVVAHALQKFLEELSFEAFLSSTGIPPGVLWLNTIMEKLEQSAVGIICLTPENLSEQWVMFEAGAIARGYREHSNRVIPYLFELAPSKLPGPLKSFQALQATEEDTATLMKRLVELSEDHNRFGNVFDMVYKTLWSTLNSELERARAMEAPTQDQHAAQVLTETELIERLVQEPKPAYMAFATRYGHAYSDMQFSCNIRRDGSVLIVRKGTLTAFSTLEVFDVFLVIREVKNPQFSHKIVSVTPGRSIVEVQPSSEIEQWERKIAKVYALMPHLRGGESLSYTLEEESTRPMYDLLTTAQVVSESDDAGFGWTVRRPTEKLLIEVRFPNESVPSVYRSIVRHASASGLPIIQKVYKFEELDRIPAPIRRDNKDGTTTLSVLFEYPMVGLTYILHWDNASFEAV